MKSRRQTATASSAGITLKISKTGRQNNARIILRLSQKRESFLISFPFSFQIVTPITVCNKSPTPTANAKLSVGWDLPADSWPVLREPRTAKELAIGFMKLLFSRSPICLLQANICVCPQAVGHSAKLYNLVQRALSIGFPFSVILPHFLRTENLQFWGYEDCWRFGAFGRRTCGRIGLVTWWSQDRIIFHIWGRSTGMAFLNYDLPWMHIISGTYYVFADRERRDGKVGRNSGGLGDVVWLRSLVQREHHSRKNIHSVIKTSSTIHH